VSVTTRAPRPGEREGRDYFFRDQAAFDAMTGNGELLEWAGVFGRSYGSPRAPVQAAVVAGEDIVLAIDWQGHRKVRAALPQDTVGVFLLPPSMAALQARLQGRGSDSAAEIAARMAKARDEMSHAREFDQVVVNDDFERAVAAVRAVLQAARLAVSRQTGLADFLEGFG
jgi:guanylate kinase